MKQTWVQSRAQAISLQIVTYLPFSLLWLWRPGSLRNVWFLSLWHYILFVLLSRVRELFPIPSFTLPLSSHGACTSSQWWMNGIKHELINFKQCKFLGFQEISWSFIYADQQPQQSKNSNVKWYNLRPRLNQGLSNFPRVTLEISLTRVMWLDNQWEKTLFIYLFIYLFIFFLRGGGGGLGVRSGGP